MGSKVKKNYIYNLIYQILLVIVPVITTPYVSRILGSEKIGIYSFTISIVTYFTLIGSLGVAFYGRREIARYQDDIKKRTEAFWQINIIKWITISLSLLIYYFTCIKNGDYEQIYFVLVLEILSNAFDITWYFHGLENFKIITIRNAVVKILGVFAIFAFVKTPDDLWIYTLIYALSNLISNLSLWVILPKYIHKSLPTARGANKHLIPVLGMFLPQAAMQVYTILDKSMLGFLAKDMREAGIYEQSQRIIKITLALVTSLGTVMSPHITSLYTKKMFKEIKQEISKAFHLVWFVSLPICFGIIAISSNIVPWFLGDDFYGAITVMQIGALVIVAIGLSTVTGLQYLVPVGKENPFTISVVAGAIINVIGNFILIPNLGAIGAIISSVIAEVLIFVIQFYIIRKDIGLKELSTGFFKCFVASLIMFVAAFLVSSSLSPSIINTAIIAVIGIATYGISLLILQEDWAIHYFNAGIDFTKKILHHGKKA